MSTTLKSPLLPKEILLSRVRTATVSPELRLRARECIAGYVLRAHKELGSKLPMPTCSFDLRGATAGRANSRTGHVQLNAVLFLENVDAFIARTIPHEVAHLVARKLHRARINPMAQSGKR